MTPRMVDLCLKAARARDQVAMVRAMDAAWVGANLDDQALNKLRARVLNGGRAPTVPVETLMRDAAARLPTITMADALKRMH